MPCSLHWLKKRRASSSRRRRFSGVDTVAISPILTGEDGVSLFAKEPLSLLAHGRRLLTSGLDYLVVDLSCGHPKQEA